jgi:hypothetical protein
MTVAPRFVRMLLSTSSAHCEAAYNRAGVHFISLQFPAFSDDIGEITAPRGFRRDLKDTGESALPATWGPKGRISFRAVVPRYPLSNGRPSAEDHISSPPYPNRQWPVHLFSPPCNRRAG